MNMFRDLIAGLALFAVQSLWAVLVLLITGGCLYMALLVL